jgi:hypothetical protein
MIDSDFSKETEFSNLTKKSWVLVYIIISLAAGILSLYLGRDINWDLKNYHYYNAYAFIEHRLDVDIAPAQLQTFINPLGDLPFYFMIKFFPSWVAGFVLGFIHGLNLSLIFSIFWKINNYPHKWLKFLAGICVVIVSGIAPGFISELGNTMHDNLTSLFVLSSVFMLIVATEKLESGQYRSGLLQTGLAGLVMGLGVGIKPSITIFAVSSVFVFGALQTSWRNRWMSLFTYGISGSIGTFITAGFWWWELWSRYGNPFFPFYNHIFRSPYFTSLPIEWSKFLPNHLWEYLAWPLIHSLNGLRVNQFRFFDIRFAWLYFIFLSWLIASTIKKFHFSDRDPDISTNTFDTKSSNYLLSFFLFSYVLWMIESSTYRFVIPLELLVPICFLIILERLTNNRKLRTLIVVGALLATFISFKSFNWGRLSWSDSYFSVEATGFDTSENAIVVMLGASPTAYVIPQLPPIYRFVRPEGNLGMQGWENNNFLIEIKSLLKEHKETVYILYNKKERNIQLEKSLTRLGLDTHVESCFALKLNTPDHLEVCRLSKVNQSK